MYIEFLAIYIGMAVLFVLLIIVMCLEVKILKNMSGSRKNISSHRTGANSNTDGVVFCKRCTTRFRATEKVCPKCGLPR